MPRIEASGITDIGTVRQVNEDAWGVEPGLSLAIVADGIGGAPCGEVASEMTVAAITAYMKDPPEDLPIDLRLKEAIRAANRRVRAHAASENGCRGMGSTVVAAAWDGDRLIVANAGDSRALLLRAGKLSQLSYDQTVGHEMEERLGWTREQSKSSGFSHVLTMAVGVSDDILIRIHEEPWTPGEQLLLCTDGICGVLDDGEIIEALVENHSLPAALSELVDLSRAAGSRDNMTAVVVRHLE